MKTGINLIHEYINDQKHKNTSIGEKRTRKNIVLKTRSLSEQKIDNGDTEQKTNKFIQSQ